MKKILFTALLLISAGMAQAQFKIDSIGHAALGTNTLSDYQFNIASPKSGLNCSAGTGTQYMSTAITGTGYHGYFYETIGVKGIVIPQNSFIGGPCVGVYGQASGSNDGRNIGLYGSVLPMFNGAGLFASSSSYSGLRTFNSHYAGFFEGDTYVEGGFTVTGVFLNSSLSSNSLTRQGEAPVNNAVSRLQLLTPSSFYIEKKAVDNSMSEDRVISENEATATPLEIPLSLIEKQSLSKQHYGLDVDQLEEVFPDLVYENEGGTKSINYVEMVPILVQAIGELKSEINELKGNGTARKISAKTTGINDVDGSVDVLALGQNKPNPFGTSTELEVSVPESVQSAFVYVYDLQGKKVQQVDITARGKQTVELNAIGLSDGMYLYSLIADGKVVETRRMIVGK